MHEIEECKWLFSFGITLNAKERHKGEAARLRKQNVELRADADSLKKQHLEMDRELKVQQEKNNRERVRLQERQQKDRARMQDEIVRQRIEIENLKQSEEQQTDLLIGHATRNMQQMKEIANQKQLLVEKLHLGELRCHQQIATQRIEYEAKILELNEKEKQQSSSEELQKLQDENKALEAEKDFHEQYTLQPFDCDS